MTRRLAARGAVRLALASTGSAAASPRQDSLFMDDPALVYGTPECVESTLRRVTTNSHGFLIRRIRPRHSGALRVSFGDLHTRTVRVDPR